ncbi:MAG TPA: hypothetical protein VMU99_02795 [Acidimicrobiales bacterium]|nr:hypothetical protein [Acidimicrobiales bacterium]
MTSPLNGFITSLETTLGILDIAEATPWMRAEDLAWSNHTFIFSRIRTKKSAPVKPLSGHSTGVNLIA